MKYYLIAGERSGDLHSSNLIKAIRRHDPQAECRGWGGEMMQAAGAELVTHYADMAFMGFWEVAKNLGTISGFLKKCKADILAYQPDVFKKVNILYFQFLLCKQMKWNMKTLKDAVEKCMEISQVDEHIGQE